jgi:hypothetical protein
VTHAKLPSFGQLEAGRRALIWGLFHDRRHLQAAATLEEEIWKASGRECFEVARSLHGAAVIDSDRASGRLSTMNVQLVTGIAGRTRRQRPTIWRLRARSSNGCAWNASAPSIQREIDRLQELG